MNTRPPHTSAHPAPSREHISVWALWFGIFGGPAAWSLQELTSAALTAHGCFPYSQPRVSPLYNVDLYVVLVGVVAFVIALLALASALAAWRRTRDESAGDHHSTLEIGEGRTRFMALSGIVVSSLFVLGVVLNTITVLLTAPCG